MKRNVLLATIASTAIAFTAPVMSKPGGGGNSGVGGGISATGSAARDLGRQNSMGSSKANDRALERANSNSALKSTVTGTRIMEQSSDASDTAVRATGSGRAAAADSASTKLSGVTTGMTVVDSEGATVGTVTGVTTKGNGSIRTVQVTLTDGRIITLASNSLTLDGDTLMTTSLETNVKSQGALHANINGLINASPNSALASAGVTSLTDLAVDLTVNNSVGDPLGTVSEIITNRSGAVVGINVELTDGGTVFVPATTLSMDGTTVVTSSTQF